MKRKERKEKPNNTLQNKNEDLDQEMLPKIK